MGPYFVVDPSTAGFSPRYTTMPKAPSLGGATRILGMMAGFERMLGSLGCEDTGERGEWGREAEA